MRRRRRNSSNLGVSLFPFLAVLICTLGVLIVLLVIAVQSASVGQHEQQAAMAEKAGQVAEKQARQKEILEDLADKIEEQSIRAEGLGAMRPEAKKELTSARDYRSYLQKEIDSLEDEAKQLAAEIEVFSEDRMKAAETLDQSDVDALRKQVADADYRLLEKRNSVVNVSEKKYAIVPYHGTGGTKRVPVFIECDIDGLVLQPWDIRLSKDDFAHPVIAGNPVDAALMTIRNYFEKYNLADNDQRPYPLLVIRPDGAQSYGLARRSLISWDDEFGYELVSSEKVLDFGEVDSQLESEIRDAVENAKQNQLAIKRRQYEIAKARGQLARRNAGGSGDGYGPGLRASSRKGGFVVEGGGRSGERNERWSGDSRSNLASTGDRDQAGNELEGGEFGNSGDDKKLAANESLDRSFKGLSSGSNQSTAESNGNLSAGNSSAAQRADSLARTRGANWALPTETAGATGYVRPVSVTCRPNEVLLEDAGGKLVSVSFDAEDSVAIDKLVTIIWQRIDTWGVAGNNAYWKPGLKVNVTEGARDRFESIKALLSGSGLTVEESQRTAQRHRDEKR